MATLIPGKPGAARPAAAPAAAVKTATSTAPAPVSEQLAPDSTSFPPLYEAAILYAADHIGAAQEVLKDYMKTTDGKNSIRAWLMLFDFYHLTNNRKEFDALSMLYTVKFERSPPVWTGSQDAADPRRKEKRDRKDFFQMAPDSDGALLAEIDRFESFAKENSSCRIDFAKVKALLSEEAELFAIVFQRLRRAKVPVWFSHSDDFVALIQKQIKDTAGLPLNASQGFWSLMFELYIFDGKLSDYEELGLEYAVAFEMSPPAWEVVVRPVSGDDEASPANLTTTQRIAIGYQLRGVINAASKDELQQMGLFAASKPEVMLDATNLIRIDFSAVTMFYEAVRAINMGQKRVILSNLNELVAALLEVFGANRHALLMRKKAA